MPHLTAQRALIVAAGLVLGAAGLAHAQTMYKWVDEKGTTHFSENPPPEDGKTKATKVEPKVTPPSSTPSASKDTPEKWRAQEAEFKRRQVERNQREEAAGREKAERVQECDRAKRRVAFLTNTHRIFRDNPDGTRSYLTDAQREQEIAKQKDLVKEVCD